MKLRLCVKPNSRVTEISRNAAGELTLKVTAPALEGQANQAVVVAMAEILNLAPSLISVASGHASKHKTLAIAAEDQAVKEALEMALD